MKDPREFHWEELKRVGRYLKGAPVGRLLFEAQTLAGELTVYCDADHAGDVETRKICSGMANMWGDHFLKHGSAVQSTIALSSSGSEYYAMLRAASHSLGVRSMLEVWGYGVELKIVIKCDSSADRGIAASQGLGKLRHVDVRYLWLQPQVLHGRLKIESVGTKDNWSDLFTKPLDEQTVRRCCEGLRF